MSLTDRIRDWFQRTPRAQEAVRRLSADLDVVASKVDSATSGLMEKVGPIIDPPAAPPPPPVVPSGAEASSAPPPTQAPPAVVPPGREASSAEGRPPA